MKVGQQGTIGVSADCSATWRLGSSVTTWTLHGVTCLPEGCTCLAVGDHGTILSSAHTGAARAESGTAGSQSAWAAGRAMPLETAMAEALDIVKGTIHLTRAGTRTATGWTCSSRAP